MLPEQIHVIVRIECFLESVRSGLSDHLISGSLQFPGPDQASTSMIALIQLL